MKETTKRFMSRLFLFSIIVQIFCMIPTIYVSALGDAPADVELKSYTFEDYCSAGVVFPDNPEILKEGQAEQRLLYYNLKSTQEYVKWYRKAIKAIEIDSSVGSNGVVFKPLPKGYSIDDNETVAAKKFAEYNSVVADFNGIMSRAGSNKLVADVYDTESWEPTNAVLLGALATFQNWCNSAFIIMARVMFYAFLAQTGGDALYMSIDFMQPILAPANAGSSTGSGSGTVKLPDWFPKFNVVSGEAIEAANKGTSGTSTSGGGLMQSNTAFKYLVLRAPRIILAFSYIVLTSIGMWPRIVAAVSGLLSRALGTIV